MKHRHAHSPLLLIEGQCALDCALRAFFVKGVNQQRLSHLGSGARKFAQYQDAVTLGLAGHVFLCHQVHPIAKGSDPADIRQLIEAHEFGSFNRAIDVDQGRPFRSAEFAVDFADKPVHLGPQVLIGVDAFAGRHSDLDQDDLLFELRRGPQQILKGTQSLGNSFCVIQPVDGK